MRCATSSRTSPHSSFDATASIFHLDADGDGLWSPDGTGNRSIPIDVTWPGVPLVGDWNGDGFDDVGKQVGTWYRVDLDGDGVWEGNAGGDRNLDFAPSFGPGVPLAGDWNGDGKDEIGTYLADGYQLLLDLNGNIVGVNSLAAGHLTLVPELRDELAAHGRGDIMIVVGGVIPPQDFDALYAAGASAIFPPGTVIASSALEMLQKLSEQLAG